jgi:hypothetical protein
MNDMCADGICWGVPLDSDVDGFVSDDCGGDDCDDEDFYSNPEVEEQCNGKDNNCDGLVDMVGIDLCNYEAFCSSGELLFCEDAPGPTTAPTVINDAKVWCATNSPFLLEANLVVLGSSSLSIGPCTEIRASDGFCFNIRGQLDAVGHQEQPVVFTSATPNPSRGSWGGLQAQVSSDAKVRLFAANVEYAVYGLDFDNCGADCTVAIEECTFSNNEFGVRGMPYGCNDVTEIHNSRFFSNSYGSELGCKTFTGCEFSGNEYGVHMGVDVNLYGCIVTGNVVGIESCYGDVRNCIIDGNSEVGITTIHDGPTITNNTITNNKIGIKANYDAGFNYFSPANNNTICDNTDYGILMASSIDYNASSNWWCTTDPDAVSSRIYDVYDDSNLGRVVFEPFLAEQP